MLASMIEPPRSPERLELTSIRLAFLASHFKPRPVATVRHAIDVYREHEHPDPSREYVAAAVLFTLTAIMLAVASM